VDGDDAGIGARLRASREAAGLSQQQLADRSGLSVRAVRNIEHGRTLWPYRDSLTRLADALGLQDAIRAEFLGAVPRRRLARQVPGTGLAKVLIVPRQLPTPVAQFVGRERQLAELSGLLGQPGASPAVISAIGGPPGVGKTALAVHFGHQAAGLFPDGQLYVNLAGFGPSGSPLAPGQAVRGFLDALGIASEQIPADLAGQAGLYRSVLAGRRMLVVLDNAADELQVRPLLPGSPGCLAVVTSRRQLAGLAAAEGAVLITLDCLPQDDALQLLAARLGAGRVAAELGAAAELVALCAGLPLALAIAAARGAARSGFSLAALAAELRDTASRLDALDAGDPAASVRAVFSWSYQQLSTDAARMFRLLGLHPGPDTSAPAAASLAGTDEPTARRLLRDLARAHLITEHVPGRYVFHDLLRAYAAAQAHDTDSAAGRKAAVARVLDHYLHTASPAALLLRPVRDLITLAPPSPGAVPEQPADHRQALTWFEAEHQVLLAAVTLADSSRFDSHAWQLPWAIMPFLANRGHYQQWAATQRTALAAATRVGDAAGQAVSSCLLASACDDLHDYDQALEHYADSLKLYQRLGNCLGQANVHQNLGLLAERQGRYTDALAHAQQALGLYQAIGHMAGQAVALNYVGWCHGLLADYHQARAYCHRSLAICAEAGHRSGEGHAWDSLGYAEHHLGNLPQATACYERALGIARERGDRWVEADTLTHLGDTRNAAGDLPQARQAWQQALAILEDIQHADAAKVSAKLGSLDAGSPPERQG
jgi:tetratricopeptide (TPR) repeat protein/transcriptional regulator with XRE-family HTH domain